MLARLNAVSNKCNAGAPYKTRMEAMNVSLTASTPGDVCNWAERDIKVWKPLIDKLGLATE